MIYYRKLCHICLVIENKGKEKQLCCCLFYYHSKLVQSYRTCDLNLVDTTTGSSAGGVELQTDDCRQPDGITDENVFF